MIMKLLTEIDPANNKEKYHLYHCYGFGKCSSSQDPSNKSLVHKTVLSGGDQTFKEVGASGSLGMCSWRQLWDLDQSFLSFWLINSCGLLHTLHYCDRKLTNTIKLNVILFNILPKFIFWFYFNENKCIVYYLLHILIIPTALML
jgi:hypothetical protein